VTLEIRGLTLTQPWATLVALGEKQIETRSWNTKYRGLVAIHAAKTFPRWAKELAESDPYFVTTLGKYPVTRVPLGAIIAIVRIVSVCRTQDTFVGAKETAFGDYGADRWAWTLRERVAFDEPIPCKGMLGLWALPPEALAACETAMGTITRE
jgi:hypothetical protein